MSNLRRKVLEHHNAGDSMNPKLLNPNKTISRKAASRASSAASSRAGSRATSRANSAQVSRQNSEDEYESDDAATVLSRDTHLDELLAMDVSTSRWEELLAERIEEILDRKRSSVEGRELAYSTYVRFLLANYCQDEIEGRTSDLADAFLRSIKAGRSEKETSLAIRALALTIITSPSETLLDKSERTLKATLTDHDSSQVKSLIISTLSISCFYVGSQTEIQEMMSYFLDIISSDGAILGARHSAPVVAAALQAWGLLCTGYSGEPQDVSDEAIDILVDHLDSSSVEVQIAAGENIALLFEMSYTEASEDMDEEEAEFLRARGKLIDHGDTYYIQKFQPYGRLNDLLDTLSSFASGSKRHLNKKDRRTQHAAFQAILRGVMHPLMKDGKPNQRLTVTGNKAWAVDEWWKLARVHGFKGMLRGGWQTHIMHNDSFLDKLGLEMSATYNYKRYKERKDSKRDKTKHGRSPRMKGGEGDEYPSDYEL